MNNSNENQTHAISNDDEIDLIQLLITLVRHWRILVLSSIIGLAASAAVLFSIKTTYTAECKVDVTQQQVDGIAQQQKIAPFVLYAQDSFLLKDTIKSFLSSRKEVADVTSNIASGCSPDPKNPEVMVCSATSTNTELPVEFLSFFVPSLEKYINVDKDNKFADTIKILTTSRNNVFDRLSRLEKEITELPPEKMKLFDVEKRDLSVSDLEKIQLLYRDIKRQRELLERILPSLKVEDVTLICDVFVTTCPNLALIGCASDKDRIWSVVVEYRKLEGQRSELCELFEKYADKNAIEAQPLKAKLDTAEAAMRNFSQVTLMQLKSRVALFLVQEQELSSLISKIQAFKENTDHERLKYYSIKQGLEFEKASYDTLTTNINSIKAKTVFPIKLNMSSHPNISKTNIKKKLMIACGCFVGAIVLACTGILLCEAFRKSIKMHHPA